jgi:hypothetical protein
MKQTGIRYGEPTRRMLKAFRPSEGNTSARILPEIDAGRDADNGRAYGDQTTAERTQ